MSVRVRNLISALGILALMLPVTPPASQAAPLATPPAGQAPPGCTQSIAATQVTIVCSTPGAYMWRVPFGVSQATFDLFGAQGGRDGGKGGEAVAVLPISVDQMWLLTVGGAGGTPSSSGPGTGGYGGGGSSASGGGGGGGASDVRIVNFTVFDRVLVAGGGGGRGTDAGCVRNSPPPCTARSPGGPGGGGGGTNGESGTNGPSIGPNVAGGGGGGGGTQDAGGAGGVPSTAFPGQPGRPGQGGSLAKGGDGAQEGGSPGGGGGGGYYGGGGGAGGSFLHQHPGPAYFGGGGGGGGGSSFGPVGTTFRPGVQSGDGRIVITYTSTAAACQPRPPAKVEVTPAGPGRLQVVVTAGTNDFTPTNSLSQLRFLASPRADSSNAVIEPWEVTAPATVSVSGPSVTFRIRQVRQGVPVTLPILVVDQCGGWQTVVGGGPGAFGGGASRSAPVPTLTPGRT